MSACVYVCTACDVCFVSGQGREWNSIQVRCIDGDVPATGLTPVETMAEMHGMSVEELHEHDKEALGLFREALNLREIPLVDKQEVPWTWGKPQQGENIRLWAMCFGGSEDLGDATANAGIGSSEPTYFARVPGLIMPDYCTW